MLSLIIILSKHDKISEPLSTTLSQRISKTPCWNAVLPISFHYKYGERKSESEPQMKLLHTLCCIILTIMIILPAATKKHSAKTTQFSHFSFLQCVFVCAFLHILHIMSFAFIFACIAASPQQNKAHNLAS